MVAVGLRATALAVSRLGQASHNAALLAEANNAKSRQANDVAAQAKEAGDAGTQDFLVARSLTHDKAAWLVCSHLN